MINLTNNDFATLAVCALRYSMGRETYMPDLVRSIVRPHLRELSDGDLSVLIRDSKEQKCFGNETIDKPGWLQWRQELMEEAKWRGLENG